MRLCCWNVNSVKARKDRVLSWLERHEPDIVCLQELKVQDEAFPFDEIAARGYSAQVYGQRAYNGVAILSREPATEVTRSLDDGVDDTAARLISAKVGDTRVICVYVPNGQEVGSDKYEYKLKWLDRLHAYLERMHDPNEPLILCGDFNCAPEDKDVAKLEQWAGGVLCHQDVRSAVARVTDWGLFDTFRKHHQEGGFYTWWDYRRLGFPKGNGLRIDQIYATKPMLDRCTDSFIDRDERKGKLPSDHAPVVADFS